MLNKEKGTEMLMHNISHGRS